MIQDAIDYCPETGVFTWKQPTSKTTKVGSAAGSVDRDGYIRLTYLGKRYTAARVAWFLMTGKWPEQQIDHRDLNRANNRWSNLREATPSQNKANRAAKQRPLPQGVTRHRTGRYQAQIGVSGKNIYLGLFGTPEEAHKAYRGASIKLHGEFSRVSP